jgi:hypothetical protein
MAATKTNNKRTRNSEPNGVRIMETQELKVQRTVFDLDTMDEVTLQKVGTFKPVETTQEALHRLANDAAKFLAVINRGLKSEEQQAMVDNSTIAWQIEDEEGKLSDFSGTPADSKAVNGLVLNLAKSVFGYSKDATVEVKRGAKESAINMIKSTEAIREGLKRNAAQVSAAE